MGPPNEEQYNAVLLLQRLLRGRAIQNNMYEGKQKALMLIRELRIAEDPVQAKVPSPESVLLDTALDTMQGEVISNALDFIFKDITRTAEERKIAALVRLANHTRRVREAEESGRRQAEDALRKKREQQYTEIMAVHSSTSGRLLEEIFSDAVEEVATANAKREAILKNNLLDKIMDRMENARDAPELIVQDLVSSFILPEVDRQLQKRSDTMEDRRHVDAAHYAVQQEVEEMSEKERRTIVEDA